MREILFGCAETTAYYRRVCDVIFTYRLYEPYTLHIDEMEATLTFFNFFRYCRNLKTGRVRAEYFSLKTRMWQKDTCYYHKGDYRFRHCPDIRLYNRSGGLLYAIQGAVITQLQRGLSQGIFHSVCESLINKRLTFSPIFKNTFAHDKRITAWLWQHFLDRPVISMLARLGYFRCMTLSYYTFYQPHLTAFNQVANDYSNLLPLLRHIKPRYWRDPNLFSYAYWVDKLGEAQIHPKRWKKPYDFQLPKSKAEWRWLKRQSHDVVRRWGGEDLYYFVSHGIQEKLPVCLNHFLFQSHSIWQDFGTTQQQLAVLRLFIRFSLQRWRTEGIAQLREYLKARAEDEVLNCRDYLLNSGEQHVPASWENLLVRSQQWHERLLNAANQLRDEKHQRLLQCHWTSPVENYQLKHVQFSALTSGQALFDEGQEMHHCIFSYVQRCMDNCYRVFSVTYQLENDTLHRATLGLYRTSESDPWKIDQQRGPCNETLPTTIKKINSLFCQYVNQQQGIASSNVPLP
ncbi:PcfJ domain-containing protein [Pasteurella testudinis]|uniref:PcfJ domain-containing protein n=1 Tax=Pasteurella testudinis TaxID=761 RepID=UPI004058E947